MKALSFLAVAVGLGILFGLAQRSTWVSSTEFHTLLEFCATLLAGTVGVLALVRYYSKRTTLFLLVGTGFLGTALLDGYHTAVTSTWFAGYFPSTPPALIPWSWVASRLFLSIMLFLCWWYSYRKNHISEGYVYALSTLFLGGCFGFFALVPLPSAYQYPPWWGLFPRPQELIPALFFFVAGFGFLYHDGWRKSAFHYWLLQCLLVNFMGQAMFMSCSAHLFDANFDLAHVLKKVSYICVLIGLLTSIYRLFLDADRNREELQKYNAEIAELLEKYRKGGS